MVRIQQRTAGQSDDHEPGYSSVGLDTKKKTVGARERNIVERTLFADMLQTLPAAQVLVIDESSTHRNLYPLYARSAQGARAFASEVRNYGLNVSLIAALRLGDMTASMVVEGSVNTAVFTAYVEHVLVPTLQPADWVLLDNLSCHKTRVVQHLIEGAGAHLLFFPAYSPDFSPIELAFSKLKTHLRQMRASTLTALIDAIATSLDLISAKDAVGYFSAAGFANFP